MKETDLAKLAIAWFESHGFDVYQEVQIHGDIADIVSVLNGKLVHIVEVKTSLSMAVLAQADRWWKYAHWRSVAVPYRKRGLGSVWSFTERVCKTLGIGMLEVPRNPGCQVHEQIPAVFFRKCYAEDVLKVLRPEHKTYSEAGSTNGRRWTPFQATCQAIERFVAANPGCNLKTLIESVQTHYASKSCAKQCISHWAQAGKVQGVRCEREGVQLRFYPEPPR